MRRFEAWRRNPSRGRRIPENLRALAAQAAGEDGVSPTARRLGLDYGTLKGWMETERPPRPKLAPPKPKAQFLEVHQAVLPSGPVLATGPICAVELQDPSGRRLRVEYRNVKAPQLGSVARMLWCARR
jgi:hypothetical protein